MPSILQATVLLLSLTLCSTARQIPSSSSSSSSTRITTTTSRRSSTSSKVTVPTSSYTTKQSTTSPASVGTKRSATSDKTSSTTKKSSTTSGKTSSVTKKSTTTSTTSRAATGGSKIATSASATNAPDGFKPGVKWQIAIQDPVDIRGGLQPVDAKVLDVDLFLASKDPTLIPALHNAGVTVLCYFNAGAIQFTDCDFPDWEDDGLFEGKSVANYDQEKYVDITSSAVINLHKSRLDLAHKIGCDGVDPDNIDTYELDPDESIGKQITQDDMISFLKTLADYAHSKTTPRGRPMMIGQKNAVEITESIHTFMDFAVSENCVGSLNTGSNRGDTDEFCSNFQQLYVNNGKPVFDIEYPESLSKNSKKLRRGGSSRRDAYNIKASKAGCSAGTSASDMDYYCAMTSSSSAGISRILKLDDDEYGLNGCTQYCGEKSSFLLPSYKSNETNSCCFGSDC